MFKTGPVFNADTGGAGGGATPPADAGAGGGAEHPVAPWGSGGVWNIGEGDKAQPWWNALPDETARKHVEAKQYASPAELALANYNLTRLQTGDPTIVPLPPKDATPEQLQEFHRKIGAPEQPDGYNEVLTFGDDVKIDPNMIEFGKKAFHEAGLTPTQAKAVAEAWNKFATEQNAQFLEQDNTINTQELDALKSKWGADLDKNKAAGQRVVQSLGLSNELIERIEGSIGSAAIVELLATIGRKSDEGGFTNGGGNGDPNDPNTMSKEQANAKITALQGDAEFQKKYTDKNHPEHKDALQLMERLFARA